MQSPMQNLMQDTKAPPQRNCSIGQLIIGHEATHWSSVLVQDHLDGGSMLSLLSTCTDAKDRVLAIAQKTTFQLTCTEPTASQASLQAVRQALQARGRQRSKLQLDSSNPAQLSYALNTLGDSITWLPSHQLFPKLKELSIGSIGSHITSDGDRDHITQSVVPFLNQLTHLSIHEVYMMAGTVLPKLITPDSIGSQLHTLLLYTELNDRLLDLILQHAPTVVELTVYSIKLQSDAQAQESVQWRRLQCTQLSLGSLALLPQAHGMELVLCAEKGGVVVDCDTTATTQQAVAARLADVQFSISTDHRGWSTSAYIGPAAGSGSAAQVNALRVGLSLLRSCAITCSTANSTAHSNRAAQSTAVQPPEIELQAWTMSAALVQELSELPSWGRVLVFDGGTVRWMRQPHMFASVLQQLPGNIARVVFTAGGLTSEQVQSICVNAPQDRTAETPLSVQLLGFGPAVLETIQQQMQPGLFPNVVLSG